MESTNGPEEVVFIQQERVAEKPHAEELQTLLDLPEVTWGSHAAHWGMSQALSVLNPLTQSTWGNDLFYLNGGFVMSLN